jgi:hypothetical protein
VTIWLLHREASFALADRGQAAPVPIESLALTLPEGVTSAPSDRLPQALNVFVRSRPGSLGAFASDSARARN